MAHVVASNTSLSFLKKRGKMKGKKSEGKMKGKKSEGKMMGKMSEGKIVGKKSCKKLLKHRKVVSVSSPPC